MHLHIVGIGGTFMGGVARLAVQAGHRVTGCDHALYPPMSDQLDELGVEIVDGFGLDNLRFAPDIWVIGNVAKRGMPIIEAILDQGLRYQSGPQWLHEHVLIGRHVLAVAGTHGKTTTTSMLTWILEAAGLTPGFLIGGVPADFGVSARLGQQASSQPRPLFVIEADEYDTAFFDKRSKFLHYPARTAVLNNLEFDHADIFADLAAIETQFHHWVRTLPSQARVIAPQSEAALTRVLERGCYSELLRIGQAHDAMQASEAMPTWSVAEVEPTTGGFTVFKDGQPVGRCSAMLAGDHNRRNALAAVVAAEHVGVAPEQAVASLAQFQGVARRLQVRGECAGIQVIDDFAHHPTAIDATLTALRAQRPEHQGGGRLLAVLEPRSNTMKLGVMAAKLPQALETAALSFGYAQGLNWDLRGALAPLGERAQVFEDLAALVQAVVAAAQPGDRIVVMSNGGFGGVHGKLLQGLAQRFGASPADQGA